MSESEARELLAAVRKASEQARSAHEAMLMTAKERSAAVRAALKAGLPREQIAEAAGTHRNLLYRIAKDGPAKH